MSDSKPLDVQAASTPIIDVVLRRGSKVAERFNPKDISHEQSSYCKLFLGCSKIDVTIN